MTGNNLNVLYKINSDLLEAKDIKLYVKRDDLVHPVFGGNKFRKLKYNLEFVKQKKISTIITFGGAFSNHIAATAFVGKTNGLKTVGVIRLSPVETNLSKTLSEAKANGMHLKFVSRNEYRNKYEPEFLNELQKEFRNAFILPEGGSNQLALKGVSELVNEIEFDFDYIITPIGTGATFFGIAQALKPHQKVIGIDVLKRPQLTVKKLFDELTSNPLFKMESDNKEIDNIPIHAKEEGLFAQCLMPDCKYHFGGYAKTNSELNLFCNGFEKGYSIAIEPVYSGKMFFGIFDLVKNNFFKQGSAIIALHTGGLQYLEQKQF